MVCLFDGILTKSDNSVLGIYIRAVELENLIVFLIITLVLKSVVERWFTPIIFSIPYYHSNKTNANTLRLLYNCLSRK